MQQGGLPINTSAPIYRFYLPNMSTENSIEAASDIDPDAVYMPLAPISLSSEVPAAASPLQTEPSETAVADLLTPRRTTRSAVPDTGKALTGGDTEMALEPPLASTVRSMRGQSAASFRKLTALQPKKSKAKTAAKAASPRKPPIKAALPDSAIESPQAPAPPIRTAKPVAALPSPIQISTSKELAKLMLKQGSLYSALEAYGVKLAAVTDSVSAVRKGGSVDDEVRAEMQRLEYVVIDNAKMQDSRNIDAGMEVEGLGQRISETYDWLAGSSGHCRTG